MKNKKNKRPTSKIGLPPETLVYVGEETTDRVDVKIVDYNFEFRNGYRNHNVMAGVGVAF